MVEWSFQPVFNYFIKGEIINFVISFLEQLRVAGYGKIRPLEKGYMKYLKKNETLTKIQ